MLNFLPYPLIGSITIISITVSTFFWISIFYPFALLKAVFRIKVITLILDRIMNAIAYGWIGSNNMILRLTRKIHWEIEGLEGLSNKKWYLVLCNHQSWTDILVLQKIFNGKIPFLKFFLKKELIWVPLLGIAWWALDFPFMKRYSQSFLEKKPHLKGKDIEITKKACAKFKDIPVSIMNFVEGTRFTREKHDRQNSPYKNLLKPKSGGVGFVFSTMGEQLTSIINVTLAYPGAPYTFWEFLCGKISRVLVNIEEIPITQDMLGDYINDARHRDNFQKWLNTLWEDKDRKIDEMLGRAESKIPFPEKRAEKMDIAEI